MESRCSYRLRVLIDTKLRKTSYKPTLLWAFFDTFVGIKKPPLGGVILSVVNGGAAQNGIVMFSRI
jgi:hypothetical protein